MPKLPILALAAALALCPLAQAAEHVTLSNGFELDCQRHEPAGDRIRLYLLPSTGTTEAGYIEVAANSILRTELIPDLPAPTPQTVPTQIAQPAAKLTPLSQPELHELLARSGTEHNIDADLLAAIVHAESNGNARAVSRVGARGLMQLMPATAQDLGVHDAFAPSENISGGTAYLDQLLIRYHDNLALALAAYNAGPLAVDRYHGIPPFAETRAYVARVIHEFNRLKLAQPSHAAALALVK